MCGGESLGYFSGFGEGGSSDKFCLKVHAYLILGTEIGIYYFTFGAPSWTQLCWEA